MKVPTITSADMTKGFTLVELLVSMVISGVVLGALYSAYVVQQKHSIAQEQVTEMQQSLRGAMNFMVAELRLAGLDPIEEADAGFVEIQQDALTFTIDFDEDGKTDGAGENISYDLYTSGSGVLTLGRLATSATSSLTETPIGSGHYEIAGHQPLAENIERVEFNYLDASNTVTTNEESVSSIQISLLARASRPDPTFTNSMTYTTASGASWVVNDNYRRRLLITTVKIRNMGLK